MDCRIGTTVPCRRKKRKRLKHNSENFNRRKQEGSSKEIQGQSRAGLSSIQETKREIGFSVKPLEDRGEQAYRKRRLDSEWLRADLPAVMDYSIHPFGKTERGEASK